MSDQTTHLLQDLAGEPTSPIVRRVRAILASPAARIIASSTRPVPASELEPTWRVRKKIADERHKRFFGIAALLERLKDQNLLVKSVSIIDERESATLFFDASSNRFIGAIVVVMSRHTRDFYAGRLHGQPEFGPAELAKTA